MILIGGMGLVGRHSVVASPFKGNLPLLCGGLGGRIPHTGHSPYRNTPLYDPNSDPKYSGMEGDCEYAMWTPESNNPYNAKSLQIFIPKGTHMPPVVESRLQALLQMLKPLTINTRVRFTESSNGEALQIFELIDPVEDTL